MRRGNFITQFHHNFLPSNNERKDFSLLNSKFISKDDYINLNIFNEVNTSLNSLSMDLNNQSKDRYKKNNNHNIRQFRPIKLNFVDQLINTNIKDYKNIKISFRKTLNMKSVVSKASMVPKVNRILKDL